VKKSKMEYSGASHVSVSLLSKHVHTIQKKINFNFGKNKYLLFDMVLKVTYTYYVAYIYYAYSYFQEMPTDVKPIDFSNLKKKIIFLQ